MCLISSILLSLVVLASTAPSPCDLPTLTKVGSQYFVFDQDCRQYAYGYNAGTSAKVEFKNKNGTVFGAYHYIDANNLTQKVKYKANDVEGFVVDGSNLHQLVEVSTNAVEVATEAVGLTTSATTLSTTATAQVNLVRGSNSTATDNNMVLFKPIISVWIPVSSYNHDIHTEISGTNRSEQIKDY